MCPCIIIVSVYIFLCTIIIHDMSVCKVVYYSYIFLTVCVCKMFVFDWRVGASQSIILCITGMMFFCVCLSLTHGFCECCNLIGQKWNF